MTFRLFCLAVSNSDDRFIHSFILSFFLSFLRQCGGRLCPTGRSFRSSTAQDAPKSGFGFPFASQFESFNSLKRAMLLFLKLVLCRISSSFFSSSLLPFLSWFYLMMAGLGVRGRTVTARHGTAVGCCLLSVVVLDPTAIIHNLES